MKTLYIIIPVYNTEKYLRRCVDSALGQTYGDVRVILVDDGSDDGSSEICDEYKSANASVSVIHQPNRGLSEARNTGMDAAFRTAEDDDYISFLDSDDFLSTDFAERMIGLCEKYGCEAAQCRYEKGSGDEFPPLSAKRKHNG